MDTVEPLLVFDDDPTGAQSVRDVPVLLEVDAAVLTRAAAACPAAIHVLTNSRALTPTAAYRIVHDAACAARAALANAQILLRGDSTLRGHVLEEYLAIRDARFAGREPILLLVPALPTAGRITVGGVHLLQRDGARIPMHETEYARDPSFRYSDGHLLRWAQERSQGHFASDLGGEIPLRRLRAEGPAAVTSALLELHARSQPAVLAPDAETIGDLDLIATGLRDALAQGADVITRSAPAFAAVYAGTLAPELTRPPAGVSTVLVICGSYVATTTRQLAYLLDGRAATFVDTDVQVLASADADAEVERVAGAVRDGLARDRLVVVATTRKPLDLPIAAGTRAAIRLAGILPRLDRSPDVVVAKGGITSAVTLRHGLGATSAWVEGPLADGVSLWRVPLANGTTTNYVVFPGNVGSDTALADVVDILLGDGSGTGAQVGAAAGGAR